MLFKYLFLVHVVDWYISFEKKISVFERCMCVHTQKQCTHTLCLQAHVCFQEPLEVRCIRPPASLVTGSVSHPK